MSSLPGPESPSERYRASAERAAEAKTYLGGFTRSLAFDLDPFQREACLSLQAGRGVLVAAPTGAGKTIVGEFAIYLALQRGWLGRETRAYNALNFVGSALLTYAAVRNWNLGFVVEPFGESGSSLVTALR